MRLKECRISMSKEHGTRTNGFRREYSRSYCLMIEIVDHQSDRHLAMNAMFEDEYYQLNEGSRVHVMKRLGKK